MVDTSAEEAQQIRSDSVIISFNGTEDAATQTVCDSVRFEQALEALRWLEEGNL